MIFTFLGPTRHGASPLPPPGGLGSPFGVFGRHRHPHRVSQEV
ncbi:hypothetical protein [Segniliparus rugosus]|nr:hypothetical protein [Segniliparus rugosus]